MTTMQKEMAVPARHRLRAWAIILGVVLGLIVGVGIGAFVGGDRASSDGTPASVQVERTSQELTRDEKTRHLVNEGYLPAEVLGRSDRDDVTRQLQNQGLVP